MASALVNSRTFGLASAVCLLAGTPLVLVGGDFVAALGVLLILAGAVGGILTVGLFLDEADEDVVGS